ncbi:hypothetical protein [Mycoplasma sp. E35C]|uniref:hypothetical protein n=1 Tax=Mycoplasma sp. E35C TaxID=2801918 RepID=UPI001CA45471|nr:hypothetical protein [Mycoplasma sp. E35C]QZX48971.1 hypothetical protein JJE79_02855 [Mycoplasma sp. E35C]
MLKILPINKINYWTYRKIINLILVKFEINKNIIPFLLKRKVEKMFANWALMKATSVVIDIDENNIIKSCLIYSDNKEQINKKYMQNYMDLMNAFDFFNDDEKAIPYVAISNRYKALLSKYESLMLNQEVLNDIKDMNQILLLIDNSNDFLQKAIEQLNIKDKPLFGFSASHLNYKDYDANKMYQIIKTPLMVNNTPIKDSQSNDIEILLYSTKQAVDESAE